MTPPESTRCDRRPAAQILSRIAPVLPTAAVLAVGATALAAGEPAGGGAGGPMPSFLLPNLLALAMSLTVLVIACKRFRKE
jgi:hypothetical protein